MAFILGEERVNIIIDSIFKECKVDRGSNRYSDYNSDQIFLTEENNHRYTYIIHYSFNEYIMDWELFKMNDKGSEILGSGKFDTSIFL